MERDGAHGGTFVDADLQLGKSELRTNSNFTKMIKFYLEEENILTSGLYRGIE